MKTTHKFLHALFLIAATATLAVGQELETSASPEAPADVIAIDPETTGTAAVEPAPAVEPPVVAEEGLTLDDEFPQASAPETDNQFDALDATIVTSTSSEPAPRGRSTAPVSNRFAGEEEVFDLATVVVNDQLGRTRIENPLSVAQFSGSDLLLRGATTSRDEVFSRAANATNLQGGFGSFAIRGINDSSLSIAFETGSNNLATIFVDQAPLSLNQVSFLSPSLWDVKSVEVFRGPQSVYQGPNSLAGAVFYDYNEPTFDFEGRSRVEYGQYETYNFALMQNIPIVDDYLATRFTYERNYNESAIRNIVRDEDDYGRTDRRSFRFQTLWRPNGDEDLTFNLTYKYDEGRGDLLGLHGSETPFFDRTSTFDAPAFADSENHVVILEGFAQLNDNWSLDSVTSAQYFNQVDSFDSDLTAFPFGSVNSFFDQEFYSQELRLSYDAGGPTRGVLGFYGQYNDYRNGFIGSFGGVPLTSTIAEIGQTAAIFANLEHDLTDRWTASAGVRFNYEQKNIVSFSQFGPFLGAAESTDQFFDILPQGSISYALSDNQTVGGLYSQGYRSGGVSVAPFLGIAQGFDQESTDNYELFYRGAFLDGRLRVNSNVFYTDWSDQQVAVNVPGGIPGFDQLIDNVGNSTVYGWEFETEFDLTEEWSVFAAVGLTKSEFGDFPINEFTNLAGSPFPYAPDWNTTLGVQYVGNNGIFGSLTWSYQDNSYSDVQDPDLTALSARNLVSSKVGYGKDNWRFYVFGTNLLDQDYEVVLFDGAGIGLPGNYGRAGEPRTVGAGFEVEW